MRFRPKIMPPLLSLTRLLIVFMLAGCGLVSSESEANTRSIPINLQLAWAANSKPLMMQADIWQATQQILLDQGILDGPIDLAAAYTTTFLDKIYGE